MSQETPFYRALSEDSLQTSMGVTRYDPYASPVGVVSVRVQSSPEALSTGTPSGDDLTDRASLSSSGSFGNDVPVTPTGGVLPRVALVENVPCWLQTAEAVQSLEKEFTGVKVKDRILFSSGGKNDGRVSEAGKIIVQLGEQKVSSGRACLAPRCRKCHELMRAVPSGEGGEPLRCTDQVSHTCTNTSFITCRRGCMVACSGAEKGLVRCHILVEGKTKEYLKVKLCKRELIPSGNAKKATRNALLVHVLHRDGARPSGDDYSLATEILVAAIQSTECPQLVANCVRYFRPWMHSKGRSKSLVSTFFIDTKDLETIPQADEFLRQHLDDKLIFLAKHQSLLRMDVQLCEPRKVRDGSVAADDPRLRNQDPTAAEHQQQQLLMTLLGFSSAPPSPGSSTGGATPSLPTASPKLATRSPRDVTSFSLQPSAFPRSQKTDTSPMGIPLFLNIGVRDLTSPTTSSSSPSDHTSTTFLRN